MNKRTQLSRLPAAERFYALILKAYPAEFRREYGPQMAQVFRDCGRVAESRRRLFVSMHFWLIILLDLVKTAPKEHVDNLRKEKSVMNNLRRDALALFGCIAIIVVAFLLLSYGRAHQVSSLLLLGYAFDAMVVTGVIGNFIVFLLVKATNLNPLRAALWTFLIVNAVPAIALAVIGSRIDPQFRPAATTIGYLVSFLFWYGLHWMWAQSKGNHRLAGEGGQ
ncbi:MAG: hypothetical protein H0V18_00025 [Pyrinomonadaceae bacterium]|nr:hypothetical protein [Pyrinomonadaceae bacterium]